MRIALRPRVAIAPRAIGIAEDAALFLAEQFIDLSSLPHVEGTFALLRLRVVHVAVRILGGKESAFRMAQVAPAIAHDLTRDVGEEWCLCILEALDVSSDELGLVIQHFL